VKQSLQHQAAASCSAVPGRGAARGPGVGCRQAGGCARL